MANEKKIPQLLKPGMEKPWGEFRKSISLSQCDCILHLDAGPSIFTKMMSVKCMETVCRDDKLLPWIQIHLCFPWKSPLGFNQCFLALLRTRITWKLSKSTQHSVKLYLKADPQDSNHDLPQLMPTSPTSSQHLDRSLNTHSEICLKTCEFPSG